MGSKRKIKLQKRRSQGDIFISVLNCVPSVKSKNPASISKIAKRCGTTWRTTKKNVDTLVKAGVVEKIRGRGRTRAKYRKII